jgi:hypothetical protein
MEKQQQAVRELFGMLAKRSDRVCNFLEIDEGIWGPDTRIVYRHYATLYIVFVVDGSESELGILDLIQVSCRETACHANFPTNAITHSTHDCVTRLAPF